MEARRAAWLAGADVELGYWRRYLERGGLDWPEDLTARLDPDEPVQPSLARFLPTDRTPRILDCAAGPASVVGKVFNGRRVELTAIDALAVRYDALLDELGIEPPVRTIGGDVERIDELPLEGGFDLVYMRFALDHLHDPVRALRQMVAAARPDGVVVIEHYRDEQSHERFAGLRQWALDPVPGDLIIRNAEERHSLRRALPGADLDVRFDDAWLTVVISRPAA